MNIKKFADYQKRFKEAFFEKLSQYYCDNLKIGLGYIDYELDDLWGVFVPYTVEDSITKMVNCAYHEIPRIKLIPLIEKVKKTMPEIYTLEEEYIKTILNGAVSKVINGTKVMINQSYFRNDGNSFVVAFSENKEEFARANVTLWNIALAKVTFSSSYREEIMPFIYLDHRTSTLFLFN